MTANKTANAAPPNVAPSALVATAVQAVAAVREAGDHAEALVAHWVDQGNAEAVARVAHDEGAPAKARKAARRGVSVLKARGVPLPDERRAFRLGADETTLTEGWFLPPDASGTYVLMITEKAPGGRTRLLQAVIREGVGLLDLKVHELTGSQMREVWSSTEQRQGFEPASVPINWARARLARARSTNASSGAILPLGLDAHADLIGSAPQDDPPHPIDAANVGRPDSDEWRMRSVALHGEPEFRGWLPDMGAVREMLEKVGEALRGSDSQDQVKVDAAIRQELNAITDRFFSPEARQVIASRMKDAAITVLARAGKKRAAEVLQVADAVLEAGLITSPPSDIPFLRGFFQKAMTLLAAQAGGQLQIPIPEGLPTESEGQIVSPAEAAAEKVLPGESVSAGGIILP